MPKANNFRSQKGQMAIPASGRTSALKRRSTRIPLHSSVAVSGEDRSKCSFTIGAKATGLNKHGGAIQIIRELLVGTTVLVRNKRGTQISARIVPRSMPSEVFSGMEFNLWKRTSDPPHSGELPFRPREQTPENGEKSWITLLGFGLWPVSWQL